MSVRVSVFAVLLASACTLNGRTMGPGGSSQPTGPQGAPTRGVPPPPPREEENSAPVYHMDKGPNFVGMTIPEAKTAAAKRGFVGQFEVHEEQPYDASCKAATVCSYKPDYWKMEHDPEDTIELYVNPTVTISAPPPP
jgi:hypothetical protein